METSIVVPTRDRVTALERCLHALAPRRKPADDVVVVDDGSRAGGAVRELVAAHPGVRLIHSPGRGPAAARNLGAMAAHGEIVCFTDDDCEPVPGWAKALAARARDGTGVAAGRTVVAPEGSPFEVASQTIVEQLQLASLDPATGRLDFAPACNLACARDLLRAEPFDDSFPDAAGEDRDWCARLAAAGKPPRYEPRAVVVHRPDLTAASFLRQQFRYGRGGVRYRHAARAAGRPGGPPAASFYRDLAHAAARRGAAVGALVGVAQLAAAAGAVAERLDGRGLSEGRASARLPGRSRPHR